MKKIRLLSFLVVALLGLAIVTGCDRDEGEELPKLTYSNNRFTVYTAAELQLVNRFLAGVELSEDDHLVLTRLGVPDFSIFERLSLCITLGADITLPDVPEGESNWIPIGGYDWYTDEFLPYRGGISGDGHTISNLIIDLPKSNYVGLIGVGEGSYIQDLTVNGRVMGESYVGGILGYSKEYLEILRSTNHCTVTGQKYIGGIIGCSTSGRPENCLNQGAVMGKEYVGGIVGSTNDCVNYCTNKGVVTGENSVGGIIGENAKGTAHQGSAYNCTNHSKVTGKHDAGGIIGCSMAGIISNCTNFGEVFSEQFAGGIAAYSNAYNVFQHCINHGIVISEHFAAGGIIGQSPGSFIACYNTAYITSSLTAGGIVGLAPKEQYITEIEGCYNSGIAKAPESIDGIIGSNLTEREWSTNACFYQDGTAIKKSGDDTWLDSTWDLAIREMNIILKEERVGCKYIKNSDPATCTKEPLILVSWE